MVPMKELKEILLRVRAPESYASPFVLATVVKVEGSSYRKPGARMLLCGNEIVAGSVSGGCLEKDVILQGQSVIEGGQPSLLNYDSTQDGDEFFGLGLGCKGILSIWIEPFGLPKHSIEIAFLEQIIERRKSGVISKVFFSRRGEARGLAFLIDESGEQETLLPIPGIAQDAKKVLEQKKSQVVRYEGNGFECDVFHEYLKPPLELTIFGTGMDVIPLVSLAKEVGFAITLVDIKGGSVLPDALKKVDRFFRIRPEDLLQATEFSESQYCIVMTHHYLSDLQILKWLLPKSPRYLGLLGSSKRTLKLLSELNISGSPTLYAPIGLDIGGETPETIALSILAEVQAVACGRKASFLRERKGPVGIST